jgi:peptidyl-prolyl cis-trans isomerase D
MFDWVHNNKRVIQVILALIFLPFAFFGVDSYFRGSELGAEVARIGDYRVSQQEFQNALRERQEAMRRVLGNAPIDQAILDAPEVRFAALEQIVRDRLLLSLAYRSGLTVSDELLRDTILSQNEFKESGKFSRELYESFLRARNMKSAGFEASLRRDLIQQPILDVFTESGFLPRMVVDRIIRLSEQRREASIATFAPAAYAAQINVDDAAAKAFFDANAREFDVPEQVRLQYVVLSLDNLAQQVEIPLDEVKQAYQQNAARYATAEEREASHILIQVPAAGATAEIRAKAKAQAEVIAKQARESPARFADLAKEYSQDPGSAQAGGDLGFLVRGATKKAFDDALFAMKPGEVSNPVETEFGYHVILLKSIRGGSGKGFEEVRGAIEAELKRARASKRFAELAEQFHNIVYEQSDSLQPAAEALKVPIQESPWITRKPNPQSPLGGERFLKAAFGDEVLKNKRNSEVMEVGQGTLMAARLLEHKPAAARPFEELRDEIRKRLVEDEARKRAMAAGREQLERIRKGEEANLAWGKPMIVTRIEQHGLAEQVVREIFRADTSKLPAYVGAEDPKLGYQLVRISNVAEPTDINTDMRNAAAEQLKRMLGQEQLNDYIAALKRRVDVKIKPGVIEKK